MKKENMLIMVVEDDKLVGNLITSTLKVNDYKYILTTTGNTAIMEAVSHRPVVILLELRTLI